jgi:hypothetical protein
VGLLGAINFNWVVSCSHICVGRRLFEQVSGALIRQSHPLPDIRATCELSPVNPATQHSDGTAPTMLSSFVSDEKGSACACATPVCCTGEFIRRPEFKAMNLGFWAAPKPSFSEGAPIHSTNFHLVTVNISISSLLKRIQPALLPKLCIDQGRCFIRAVFSSIRYLF